MANIPTLFACSKAKTLQKLVSALAVDKPALEDVKDYIESVTCGIRATVKRDIPYYGLVTGDTDDKPNLNCVCLTTDKHTTDFSQEINRQCNGVVIDCDNWKVLAMMSPQCTTFKKSVAETHAANFNVFLAKDGTQVAMYYKNGIRFATSNGLDVAHATRFGQTTFAEAVCQLLTGKPKLEGLDILAENAFYDDASKNKCYVLGFRHHDFHLLETDPPSIWLIAAYDLTTLQETTCEMPISRQEIAQLPLAKYYELSANSLADYKASLTDTPLHFYGLVFRGKNLPVNVAQYSNMFMESNLMRNVRQSIYDFSNVPICPLPSTPHQRCVFVTLKGVLSPHRREFAKMYPQLPTNRYEKLARDLSVCTLLILGGDRPTKMGRCFAQIADTHAAHLAKYVSVRDPNAKELIVDYFMSKDHLATYYWFEMAALTEAA